MKKFWIMFMMMSMALVCTAVAQETFVYQNTIDNGVLVTKKYTLKEEGVIAQQKVPPEFPQQCIQRINGGEKNFVCDIDSANEIKFHSTFSVRAKTIIPSFRITTNDAGITTINRQYDNSKTGIINVILRLMLWGTLVAFVFAGLMYAKAEIPPQRVLRHLCIFVVIMLMVMIFSISGAGTFGIVPGTLSLFLALLVVTVAMIETNNCPYYRFYDLVLTNNLIILCSGYMIILISTFSEGLLSAGIQHYVLFLCVAMSAGVTTYIICRGKKLRGTTLHL